MTDREKDAMRERAKELIRLKGFKGVESEFWMTAISDTIADFAAREAAAAEGRARGIKFVWVVRGTQYTVEYGSSPGTYKEIARFDTQPEAERMAVGMRLAANAILAALDAGDGRKGKPLKHDPYCDCGICQYCRGDEDVYGNSTLAEEE